MAAHLSQYQRVRRQTVLGTMTATGDARISALKLWWTRPADANDNDPAYDTLSGCTRNQFIERFGGAGCSPRLGSEPLLCARYFGSLNLHRGRGAGTRPTVRQEEITERDNDERANHDTE
jgi:hypothetical protein